MTRSPGDLLHISRQLQKSVTQKLEDSRRGGKQTSLLMGRRLDAHAIARLDGRVFCKNALPNEAPALSVGLLLDESGSMCSCDRATYARATAIILYDFCRALDIPIMVYGHSTSSGRVDLYSYASSTPSTGMIATGSWTSPPAAPIRDGALFAMSPSSWRSGRRM